MFDPYHKWLGIPPGESPPTFYQLLSISPVELDREVIEGGADRASRHVQEFQSGPHAKEASRVLAEIAFARRTLVDSAKRAIYDATLRAEETIRKGPNQKLRKKTAVIFRRPVMDLVLISLGIAAIEGTLRSRRAGPPPSTRQDRASVAEAKPSPVAAKPDPSAPASTTVEEDQPTPALGHAAEDAAASGEKYIKLGIVAEGANDRYAAIAFYTWAIRVNPGSATAYNRRAWAFILSGMYNPANADYDIALEIEPENPWHYTGRGFSYFKTGNTQGAIDNYDAAIKADPGYANAYIHRSWAYRKLGNEAQADADRAKALSLDPGQAANDAMYR